MPDRDSTDSRNENNRSKTEYRQGIARVRIGGIGIGLLSLFVVFVPPGTSGRWEDLALGWPESTLLLISIVALTFPSVVWSISQAILHRRISNFFGLKLEEELNTSLFLADEIDGRIQRDQSDMDETIVSDNSGVTKFSIEDRRLLALNGHALSIHQANLRGEWAASGEKILNQMQATLIFFISKEAEEMPDEENLKSLASTAQGLGILSKRGKRSCHEVADLVDLLKTDELSHDELRINSYHIIEPANEVYQELQDFVDDRRSD